VQPVLPGAHALPPIEQGTPLQQSAFALHDWP
jgi:hypothetical protein